MVTTFTLFIVLYNSYNMVVSATNIAGFMNQNSCEQAYEVAHAAFGKYAGATHVCIEVK